MNISLCKNKSGQMLQAVLKTVANLDARVLMRGFLFRLFLNSERYTHICLAPSENSNVWRQNIHVWTHSEPFSRYVSTLGSKRRYHSSRVCVDVAGRDGNLNKQFSPSRNRFLLRTPTSQDRRFTLRQLLWPEYLTGINLLTRRRE